MVIGATGSGKTTLVDGMINYITDVSWEDEFRFSMVDLTEDEKKRKASEVRIIENNKSISLLFFMTFKLVVNKKTKNIA